MIINRMGSMIDQCPNDQCRKRNDERTCCRRFRAEMKNCDETSNVKSGSHSKKD